MQPLKIDEFTPEMLKYIPGIRHFVQAIVPFVYDNSLSYFEFLAKVSKYLNEMIGRQNQLSTLYDSLVTYTNQSIQTQVDFINNFQMAILNDFQEFTSGNQRELENLKSYLENYIENINVQEDVTNYLNALKESGELAEIAGMVIPLVSVTTAPANPSDGDQYYNNTEDQLYRYQNNAWIPIDVSVNSLYTFNGLGYLGSLKSTSHVYQPSTQLDLTLPNIPYTVKQYYYNRMYTTLYPIMDYQTGENIQIVVSWPSTNYSKEFIPEIISLQKPNNTKFQQISGYLYNNIKYLILLTSDNKLYFIPNITNNANFENAILVTTVNIFEFYIGFSGIMCYYHDSNNNLKVGYAANPEFFTLDYLSNRTIKFLGDGAYLTEDDSNYYFIKEGLINNGFSKTSKFGTILGNSSILQIINNEEGCLILLSQEGVKNWYLVYVNINARYKLLDNIPTNIIINPTMGLANTLGNNIVIIKTARYAYTYEEIQKTVNNFNPLLGLDINKIYQLQDTIVKHYKLDPLNYIPNSNMVTVNAIFPATEVTIDIPYPTGFTYQNCTVISFLITRGNPESTTPSDTWYLPPYFVLDSNNVPSIPAYYVMSPDSLSVYDTHHYTRDYPMGVQVTFIKKGN